MINKPKPVHKEILPQYSKSIFCRYPASKPENKLSPTIFEVLKDMNKQADQFVSANKKV